MCHILEKYKLHKLWIMTFETNLKMRHIISKSGFKKEGLLDEDIQRRISETISLLYSLGRAPTDIGMGKTMT